MEAGSKTADRLNPFLISTILFGIALYFQRQRCKASKLGTSTQKSVFICCNITSIFKPSNIILILFVTSLISFSILETYYHEQCPIDPVRYNQALQIFTINVTALKQMQVEYVAYFGTLLYILRQTLFAIWDQDSDILIVKPQNVSLFVEDFTDIISNLSMEYNVVYYEQRDLIQVKHDRAHGDIWIYTEKNVSIDDHTLSNYDYTTSHPIVNYDLVFPSHNIEWFGFEVAIPNKEKLVAVFEFGNDYIIPQYHIVWQCLVNIVTYKISAIRCFLYLMTLILGNFVAISIKTAMHNKQYCGRLKRNCIWVIIQLVPTKCIDLFVTKFNNMDTLLSTNIDNGEKKPLLSNNSE